MRAVRLALALSLIATSAVAQGVVPAVNSALGNYVLTPREYYAMQGQAYVATTNVLTNPPSDSINIVVCNTYTTGGKSLYVFKRRFDNNVAYNVTAMIYGGLSGVSASTLTGTASNTSVTAAATTSGTSTLTGSPPSTGMTMTYGVGTTRMAGTLAASGYLPTAGDTYKLEELRIIPPQTCFSQFMTNPTAALGGASAGAAFTFYWWEQ